MVPEQYTGRGFWPFLYRNIGCLVYRDSASAGSVPVTESWIWLPQASVMSCAAAQPRADVGDAEDSAGSQRSEDDAD